MFRRKKINFNQVRQGNTADIEIDKLIQETSPKHLRTSKTQVQIAREDKDKIESLILKRIESILSLDVSITDIEILKGLFDCLEEVGKFKIKELNNVQ